MQELLREFVKSMQDSGSFIQIVALVFVDYSRWAAGIMDVPQKTAQILYMRALQTGHFASPMPQHGSGSAAFLRADGAKIETAGGTVRLSVPRPRFI